MNVLTTVFLERALADFTRRHVERYRLDNPQVNIVVPDEVPYDAEERARDLTLKVPPIVFAGYKPKVVSGEIDKKLLPQVPFISFRAMSGRLDYRQSQEIVTVSITVCAFDQNEDRSGYRDVLNMIGILKFELPRFRVIDQSFPIVPPITWELTDVDLWPYFFGEMTTNWQLPVASHIAEVTTATPWVGEVPDYIREGAGQNGEPQALFKT